MNEKQGRQIRFPAREISPDVFECPCGRNGLHRFHKFATGLDDADPDWGSYEESYGFATDDPCFWNYIVLDLDGERHEFVLLEKDSTRYAGAKKDGG